MSENETRYVKGSTSLDYHRFPSYTATKVFGAGTIGEYTTAARGVIGVVRDTLLMMLSPEQDGTKTYARA